MSETGGPSADRTAARRPARALLLRSLPFALIVLATAAVYGSGVWRTFSFEHLLGSRDEMRSWVAAHTLLALAAYGALYVAVVALSVPGALLLTIAGGFLFGALIGGTVTVFAATLGASLLFLAAQGSLGAVLRARAGPWLSRIKAGFSGDAVSYLLFLRLVPLFPFWLVNLAPALLDVRLRTFVWTTFVGIAPATFAYAYAGASLESVAAAQKQAYESCLAAGEPGCKLHVYVHQFMTRDVLFTLVALGILALIPAGLRRWNAWRAASRNTLA